MYLLKAEDNFGRGRKKKTRWGYKCAEQQKQTKEIEAVIAKKMRLRKKYNHQEENAVRKIEKHNLYNRRKYTNEHN